MDEGVLVPNRTRVFALSLGGAVVLATAGCGGPEPQADGRRTDAEPDMTITVAMDDALSYTPSTLSFEVGDIVRFDVVNDGQTRHEFVLGTTDEQQAHAAEMTAMPSGDMDDGSVSLGGGESGQVTWEFTAPGEYRFACHEPGHFEAGMVGSIVVGG